MKTTVQPGGKVGFASPELEARQTVDVVVLHESRVKGRSIVGWGKHELRKYKCLGTSVVD